VNPINLNSDFSLPDDLAIVGRITGVHGIKGWVKIRSYTQEQKKIFNYNPWWLSSGEGWKSIKVSEFKTTSHNLIAHIENFDDRDVSNKELCQRDIAVERSKFPKLGSEEYYWYQLKGLRVFTAVGKVDLGTVTGLVETGANEVLEIQGDIDSLDLKQRLIPYVKQVILLVNFESNSIEVDWDPEF
jgi:16S rRNA processing protein RimM